MTRRHGIFSHAFLLLVLSFGLGLAGCEGDDGAPGRDGIDGQIDWQALGWSDDPVLGGARPD